MDSNVAVVVAIPCDVGVAVVDAAAVAAEQGTTNIEQRTLRVEMWWGESSLRLNVGNQTGNQTAVAVDAVLLW